MNKIFAIVFVSLLVTLSARAQLQVPDSIRKYDLEEIIIQSPKYNRNIFDIPVAATMVPERLLENNRVENLTDISPLIPNFFMPDYGSKLTSPVYIRGIGNRINTPSVGLYVDEIPYFEKAAFNFDFYGLERVEVLRGPQGTLYGRNAMGGLINVITSQPQQQQITNLGLDYGNYNQIRTTLSHNQPVSESISIIGSLSYRHNNGFYTNEFLKTDVDRINSYSGRVKARYAPTERFSAVATIQYEDSRQGGYPYALFDPESMHAKPVSYDNESIYNRKLLSVGAKLNYSLPGATLRSSTSFQQLNDEQGIDQDFTPASLFFVNQDQKMNIVAQELVIESDNDRSYNWLFGAFGFRQQLDKSVKMEYGEDGIAQTKLPYNEYFYIKFYDNSNSGIALFHQSTFNFGKLSVSAGIRADYERASLNYIHDISADHEYQNVEIVSSGLNFFEVLPRIALRYNISKYLVPYATVAKGYNSGGFNATFEREQDRSFDPERSWNYEAGIKAKWLQQRVYGNLAFFYIDWSNQQIYQVVPSGAGSMLTNAGKSESKGVEMELKALPANNLETWLTLGYNKARFVKYVKDENQNFNGNYLPYVPLYTFNVGGNYRVNIRKDWLEHVVFDVSYNGVGKHYWHETNEAYQPFYGLLNTRISFEKQNISLSLWAKNLFNASYNSFYFQALGNSYVQIGKPATMGVKINLTI